MAINLVIDIIFVLIMLIGIVIGLKKGFINTVAKPVRFVLAIFLAFTFASNLASSVVQPLIAAPITNQLSSYLTEKFADVTAETVDTLPTLVKLAAGLCGIDVEEVASSTGEGSVIAAIVSEITDPFATIICTVVSFILIFFAAKLVLSIAFAIINKVVDNGFIGVANRIIGCIFTTALAFIICWGVASVFELVIHLPVFEGQAWVSEFTGGYIYNFLKSISPIDLLLSF